MPLKSVKKLHNLFTKALFTNPWRIAVSLIFLYTITFVYLMPIGVLNAGRAYRIPAFLTPHEILLIGIALAIAGGLLLQFSRYTKDLSVKHSLLLISFCAIPFIFTYPVDALDYIANLWYSERTIVYGENPYTQIYSPQTLYPLTTLPSTPTSPHLPYGPIWLAAHSFLYNLIRTLPLVVLTLVIKMVHIVLVLITMWLLLRTANKVRPDNVPLLTAIGMSPVILFTFIGTLHNDVYFILGITLMITFLQSKRFTLALLSLVVSVYIKYVVILLVPLVFLWIWRNTTPKQFITSTLLPIILFIALAIYSFLGLGIHHGIQEQSGFIGFSPAHILTVAFNTITVASTYVTVAAGIFLTLYLLTGVSLLRKSLQVHLTSLLAVGAFVLTICMVYLLNLWNYWYIPWLLPFVIAESRKTIIFICSVGLIQIFSFFCLWHAVLLRTNASITPNEYSFFVVLFQSVSVGLVFAFLHISIIIPTVRRLL